jgi:hypothetical protein
MTAATRNVTDGSGATATGYPSELRMRAASLRLWAADEGAAKVYDQVADELEEILRRQADHALTLAEASRETGYSDEHLGRLVRTGKIANAGRKNAPRIRRGDLPHKARKLRDGPQIAGHRTKRYDPDADARSLLSRRGAQ